MENWRDRARNAGLTQRMLARLTGVHENTVSRQFKGDWDLPQYVKSAVVAWEIMTEEQRREWLQRSSLDPG